MRDKFGFGIGGERADEEITTGLPLVLAIEVKLQTVSHGTDARKYRMHPY